MSYLLARPAAEGDLLVPRRLAERLRGYCRTSRGSGLPALLLRPGRANSAVGPDVLKGEDGKRCGPVRALRRFFGDSRRAARVGKPLRSHSRIGVSRTFRNSTAQPCGANPI